ncbi:formate dehydrogenase beta subunit [Hellea balneolensis]|uniref:formate dehydrogenase beta subunit n=1 Tax=Hellea balneolensis TaxID=287478 RepID=UPI0003F7A0DB|nr:formate dehydrogenase beta subunit [Hellea balneolensis]
MSVKIYIPRDSAALSVGAYDVAEEIKAQGGNDVEIIATGSRGMLWLEPLVEVETDAGRVAYGPVQPEDVKSLFDAGFLNGGDHKLSHGLTEVIPYFAKQDRLTFARVGVIDRLSLADYEVHGGLKGLKKALSMPPESIVEEVLESGLRGRGGAGFPTGIKWKTAHAQTSEQKYICANADEGDSGTFADRMLMEGDPFSLIEGMIIGGRAIGAETGYVYIRSEYPHAIRVMRRAVKAMEDAGWLGQNIGGSDTHFDLHIRVGAGAYICGEESSMLESIEGKRGQVKVKPPIPAISGLFNKPTIVNNVLTLATVPFILSEGAKTYADYGQGRSRGTQPFQLAGDVAQGGLIEMAFGVTIDEIVNEFGGGTRSGRPVKAVQIGGPLGGYLTPGQFETSLGYESLAEAGGMIGHGGIVVYNDTTSMMKMARYAMEFCELESCGKCTPCRIGSVRGKETLDKIAAGEDVAANLDVLEDLCDLMEEASLCAMGGLTPMPVRTAMKAFPEEFTGPLEKAAE